MSCTRTGSPVGVSGGWIPQIAMFILADILQIIWHTRRHVISIRFFFLWRPGPSPKPKTPNSVEMSLKEIGSLLFQDKEIELHLCLILLVY